MKTQAERIISKVIETRLAKDWQGYASAKARFFSLLATSPEQAPALIEQAIKAASTAGLPTF